MPIILAIRKSEAGGPPEQLGETLSQYRIRKDWEYSSEAEQSWAQSSVLPRKMRT